MNYRSVFALLAIFECAIHLALGNEFKFEYNNSSPDTIELAVVYDGYRIEAIKYGNYREYMQVRHAEVDRTVLINHLTPCTFYQVSAKVRHLGTNQIFGHKEHILTIPPNIVLQAQPDLQSIYVEMNLAYEKCFDSVFILVDNSRYIWYTQQNLSSWLTITDLSPCVNYNLTIYINYQSYQFKIYDKSITTISMQYRQVTNIYYDQRTSTLRWPNFLGDCTLKYQIIITPDSSALAPITRESDMNEYQLDFLDGCSKYFITVTSETHRYSTNNITIETGYKEPGQITSLAADLINNDTLFIKWIPPIDNPACIENYNIQIDTASITTKAHEHTMLDYKPCTDYNITVCQAALRPKNCINYIFNSSKFDVIIHNVSTIDTSTNYIEDRTTIVWNVSNYDKHCVKYYDVRLYNELKQLIYRESVNSTKIKLFGLFSCQTYRLQIETSPVRNWPTKIESDFEFTTKSRKPDAPQPPELISQTIGSLTLKIDYVNKKDKCKIEMFQISCNDREEILRSVYYEEGSGTITNLKDYSSYSCSGKVKNEMGWSISSTVNSFFLNAGKLNADPEVYVYSISSKSIGIKWIFYEYADFLNITKVESNEKHPMCESSNYDNSIKLTNKKIRKHLFDNLEPNTNYSIQVGGRVNNQHYIRQIFVTTDPDVPFQVANLKILHLSSRSVTITWQLPCTLNGRVKHFVGKVFEIDPINLAENLLYNWTVPYYGEMQNFEIFNYTENRLKPEHKYDISVAIKLVNFVGALNESKIRFNSSDHPLPLDQFTDWATIIEQISENHELQINETILNQQKSHEFKLLISEAECKKKPDVIEASPLPLKSDRCTWECEFNATTGTVRITLHDHITKDCGNYEPNHIELKRGTDYIFEGLFLTSSGDTIRTPPIPFKSKLQISLSFVEIFGIIVLCLVFLAIPVTIGWYYKFKKNRSSPPDSTYIEVEYFSDFYKLLTQDYYEHEYQSLSNINLSDLSQTASIDQPGKNRYTDITPYDYNRVVLGANEFCTSDYINASYIDGYKHKNQYIATQGPKEETAYDFWHMVVDQKCDKIVMLTQLQEDSITKCFRYFPHENETLEFNDLAIANVDETNFGNFIRRGFIISKGAAKRFIVHFQFIAWPDRDCPTNKLDLIEFIEFTKSVEHTSMNPMIVHCSAGVGRTGTFIALDVLFQSFRKEKYISIRETVQRLRKQRCRMVQTVDQYEFVYASMNMYYLKRVYKGQYVEE